MKFLLITSLLAIANFQVEEVTSNAIATETLDKSITEMLHEFPPPMRKRVRRGGKKGGSDSDSDKCEIEDSDGDCWFGDDPSPALNSDKYSSYYFEFSNGEILKGTSEKNDINVNVNGKSFIMHVSCSDTYQNGYGDKGGPQPEHGVSVVDYKIYKYHNKNGKCKIKECPCGDFTPPTTTATTTTCVDTTTTEHHTTTSTQHHTTTLPPVTTTEHHTTTETLPATTVTSTQHHTITETLPATTITSTQHHTTTEHHTTTSTQHHTSTVTQNNYITVTETLPPVTTTETTTVTEPCTNCFDDCLAFNALVKEDWTYETICDPGCGSDIQGKLMVGGNLNLDPDYTIADQINPSSDCSINAMEIGGNVNWDAFGRLYGNGIVGGTSNTDANQITGSNNIAGVCDISYDTNTRDRVLVEFAKYETLSNTLLNLPDNGPTLVNNFGQVTVDFTGYSSSDIIVFHIDFSNVVDSFNFVNYQGQVVVFNIEDQHQDTFRATINGGSLPEEHHGKMYWNFHGVNQLTLNIQNNQLYGRFIAPYTDVTGLSGTLWGQIVANSFTGNLQINDAICPEVCF